MCVGVVLLVQMFLGCRIDRHYQLSIYNVLYVDFLNISKLVYNWMKLSIDKLLSMFYFMICNIRRCFNSKYTLFMFP